MPQSDTDARWTKKNGKSYYGYKNSVSIDIEHGFLRNHEVSPANIHHSQVLPAILDPLNLDDFFLADSACSGELFEEFLSAAGFESFISERGYRNNLHSQARKAFNSVKSRARALVEHVFGNMVMTMHWMYTRLIGLKLNMAWWRLRNLT